MGRFVVDPPRSPWVVPLVPGASGAPGLLGGKARAVLDLVDDGHPVPRSVVLTTVAFREVTATGPLRDLGRSLAGTPDADVDRAFLDADLPESVRRAILDLGGSVRPPVAVRSSATAEDLGEASYAGQYRTVLDVDAAGLERAVRLVWASTWHDAPRRYRARRPDDPEPLMAVLVMESVVPVTSGVLFTRDPVGDAGDVRLETVSGPGEGLVSGSVTPTVHTWPRRSASGAAAAELGRPFAELVDRALALEHRVGGPVDVEFTVDPTDTLWLLQARPVTTRTDGQGVAEMLPGVLGPLLRSTAGRHVDDGFRVVLDRLGADLPTERSERFVRFVHGRVDLDLELLRRVVATVPGASVAELDRGYGLDRPDAPEPTRRALRRFLRTARQRQQVVLECETVVRGIDLVVERDADPTPVSDLDLLARWDRIDDLAARTTAAEMAASVLAASAHRNVEAVIARRVGPAAAAPLALAATTPNPDWAVDPVSRRLRSPVPTKLLGQLTGTDRAGDERRLERDEVGSAFLADWRRALARSGSRAVYGGPTWADDPDLAWSALTHRRHHRCDPGHAAAGSPHGLTGLQRRFAEREAAEARALLHHRDATKRALLDLGGVAHRTTLELADRLVRRGVVTDPEDVWLLEPHELRAALLEVTVPSDLALRRRDLQQDRRCRQVAPARPHGGTGWAASPGLVTGPAVVLDTPRAGAVRPGDVIVARTTDAGWAPLFAIAGGIVVEEGGPLSHAAIVAREFGIPAVVHLPGVVDRVRDAGPSAVVTVDGSAGTVTIAGRSAWVVTAPPTVPPEPEQRTGVFVSGLVGVTTVFGAVVSVTRTISTPSSTERTVRRSLAPARCVADVVAAGTGAVATSSVGLLRLRTYRRGWITAATLLLAVALSGGAVVRHLSTPLTRVGVLAATLSTVLGLALVGRSCRAAERSWPDVPATVRRCSNELGVRRSPGAAWRSLPTPHRDAIVALTAFVVVAAAVARFAPDALGAVDRRLVRAFGIPDDDPWGPAWLEASFGRRQVVIPAAIAITLLTVRCRILVLAYPLTIAVGGLTNLGLGAVVGRHRPPFGEHPLRTDSFPSGHAIEVTLLFGLLPLGLAVLTRSRAVGTAARAIATPLLVLMLADGVRSGAHWPTDHVAGTAIALVAVVAVHGLASTAEFHRACSNCPTTVLRRARENPDASGVDP